MSDYTEADIAWGDPPAERIETNTPKRCRRHEWPTVVRAYVDSNGFEHFSKEWGRCLKCDRPYDENATRRGRTNRSRGNAIERDVAKALGLKRTGQFGGPDDASGELFVVQVKSGKSFPERIYRWLKAVPTNATQTPLVVVTDAPGPGHRRRALVVLTIEDWVALHGPMEDAA